MLTGGLVITGLLIGSGLLRDGASLLGGVRRVLPPLQNPVQESEPKVDVQSVVVQQVQGMSELTTAKFTMQAVVPTSRDRTFAGYRVGSTTLLYIAHGEVRAGIDLSQITRENVQLADNNALTIQLPPPKILDSKIDVNRSQVYDYDRGFLGLGPDAAPELQQLAQQQTLQQVVSAACNEGILQEANTRAELAIRQLLTTTGYGAVTVLTQAPPPGSCVAPSPTAPAAATTPTAPSAPPPATAPPAVAPSVAAPSVAPATQAPANSTVPSSPSSQPLPAEPLPANPSNPLPQTAPNPPLG
ncbi:DUF4230 domain-containing protein [Leptolyngbya sp. FACHB-16]|nr:DUF4230 domain-containing protein [Leptolyngbya sp. FACHB-8]MBD2156514.1 DUF4230 domain-containing protein [Leptolyngbya sp. FACHB-16]